MQIDGDVTILTKTKPLADETNTILSHTQTSVSTPCVTLQLEKQ